jgi:hypothetical protein
MDIALKNKSDITGTYWIEFNVSRTLNNYKYWADNSKYLCEYAYNFYTDIFEKVADNFNYYGDTGFTKEQLKRLKNEIKNRIKNVDTLNTLQDIIEFGKKTSHALNLTEEIEKEYNKQNNQPNKIISDIKQLGHGLLDLLDNCIQHDKILIVLGP